MNDDELAIFKEQNETIERLQKEMEQQRLDVADFRREWRDAMREKSKVCEELDAEKVKSAALAQALANIAAVLKDPELTALTEEPESASFADDLQRSDAEIVCEQCMGDDTGNRRAAEVSSKIPRQEWPVGDPRRLPWEAKFVCKGCGKKGNLDGVYTGDGRAIPGISLEWPLGWKDGYCGTCYVVQRPEIDKADIERTSPRNTELFVCAGCGGKALPRVPLGWEDGYCGACFAGEATGPMGIFRG